MEERTIYITEYDMKRLRELLRAAKWQDPRGNPYLESLEAELNRGQVVTPDEIPPDVVTMNSRVRLVDLDTAEEMVLTLVFPDQADPDQDRISILAPIGTAVLGYRLGDTFSWRVPAGLRRLRIEELLYQPEAAGDYHL